MEPWILIVAAIVVTLLITFGVGYFRTKNVDGKKPYQPREINKTNYNVAATFTDEQLENMTPAEAREVVRKAEAGEETSLSEQASCFRAARR